MDHPRTLVLAGLALIVTPAWLVAQYDYGGYGGGYYRSSTVGESHARGMADLVRSAGDANLKNSEAAGNYEDARAKNFDNRLKYTETYFQQKQLNREYRKAKRGPRPDPEQLYRRTRARMPDRPTPNELDPVFGRIKWPRYLQQDEFASDRMTLEKLFSERASGEGSSKTDQKIIEAADAMVDTLRKIAKRNVTDGTITANKFIRSLKHEMRFSPG
ncbi:MAG: hypothetical protein BMS9Abin04_076 [Planctomycetia bacterium]|nr:MAG: hypothetical protein BMS9Abin04_076 [Planctomycetia bacterium]